MFCNYLYFSVQDVVKLETFSLHMLSDYLAAVLKPNTEYERAVGLYKVTLR